MDVGVKEITLRFLKREEWTRLVSTIFNLRDSILFEVLYETGCSVSDLVDIKINDVGNSYIKFNKRISVISPKLYAKIKTYLELEGSNREYLFCSRQSPKITQKRVIQIVRSYSKRVGFEITPQILRYTHMAHAYDANVPIGTIIAQVGIKKARAIQIFSELTAKDQASAYQKFYEHAYQ